MVETIHPAADSSTAEPLYEVILYPHRSLSPSGFVVVMTVFLAFAATAGIWFLLLGAWPVFGFFGVDMALLYWAFRASYRAGEVCEHIRLCRDDLILRRSTPGQQTAVWHFSPGWVSIAARCPRGHPAGIYFSSHGTRVIFGRFLSGDEILALAGSLQSFQQSCISQISGKPDASHLAS